MSTPNDNDDCETYDIPKLVMSFNYDCPKNLCRSPMSYASTTHNDKTAIMSNICSTPVQEDSYDIPRPLNSILHQQKFITPSTSNSSLLTFDCSFSSSSNRSSLAYIPDYDIPRRNPVPIRALQNSSTVHSVAAHLYVTDNENNLQGQSVLFDGSHTALRSIQSSFTKEDTNAPAQEIIKELPLELSSALDTLAKLQSESTLAITRFLSFVAPNWRVCEKLEAVIIEVKLAAVRLRTALHDLTEFSEGALGNAMRSEDRTLGQKLKLLVKALKEADKLIHESSVTIEVQGGWTLENLARSEDKTSNKPPDSLEQLIACAQTLIEDVRQTTSFIQGNALLLFKRNIPAPIAVLSTEDSNADSVENYDYVSFESKDSSAKKNSELREAIQPNLQKKFDSVIKSAETSAVAASNEESQSQPNGLTDRDKLLVKYYAVQISTHMGNLRQAIDSFLETVEKNQPPKFFIAYGKFVVVSAHNLVTIGDIVHRNVSKSNLKHELLHCTDALSEALKSCVAKSKKAAAHFPSVTAVQEMVDSVVNISHLSFDLKTAMLQAVQLAF